MLIRLTPFLAIALLSGCTLTNSEQNTQQTLTAINAVETNISTQIESLNQQLVSQAQQIERLEKQVTSLDSQARSYHKTTLARIKSHDTQTAAPIVKAAPAKTSQSVVLGEIEKVTIDAIDQTFEARVDTGAATSSLNAIDIEQFERNGKNWVRFHLSDGSTPLSDDNWIEAPVIRFVKIRQSTNEEVERRAVIELWVKVGSIHEKAQFTLADRSQMSNPILLGREFIRDIAVVDVSKKYVQSAEEQKK